MNVFCFGCSFTEGITEQPYTWVHSLAAKYPEHNFYNIALQGSSLAYSLALLNYCRKNIDTLPVKYDKIIFQITGEGRLTIIPELYIKKIFLDFTNDLYHWNRISMNNYYKPSLYVQPTKSSFIICNNYANNRNPLAKLYYKYLSKEHNFSIEWLGYVLYLKFLYNKGIIDYMLIHRNLHFDFEGIISDIDVIEKILGPELWQQYLFDTGHFTKEGSVWEGDFIATKLDL